MELPEENLKTYWKHLKLCDYPNINKMDEHDVQKILSKENRINFLNWALIKLIPDYEYRLEASKQTKKLETTIADLICGNGFCKASEKINFTKSTMKTDQEIPIFNRLFKSLSAVYSDTDKENVTSEISSLKYLLQHPSKEYFEQRILCDGNIFEGTFKKMTEKEKTIKYESLKKAIEQLDSEIKEAEIEKTELQKTFDNIDDPVNITKTEIVKLLNKLKDVSTVFSNDFPEYSINFSTVPDLTTNTNLGPILDKTSNNLDYVLKVLKNEDYMKNNKDIETIEEREDSTSDDYSEFIVSNYVVSEEILDGSDLNKSFDSAI